MGAQAVAKLSVEEYLALDRVAERPSEYHDGEVFVVEAASYSHAVLLGNLSRMVGNHLVGKQCRAVIEARVRLSPQHFVVPDLAVVCGTPLFADNGQETITNPQVVVEILSPRTEDYDYGRKFVLCRRLASLEEYVLVAQEEMRVDVYRKTADGRWVLTIYEGRGAVAGIECVSLALPLEDIYDGVALQ